MSSERAGVHTSGTLNREQARELGWRSDLKPFTEAWFDALDSCVVPDPRITHIEALLADLQRAYPDPAPYDVASTVIDRLHAALEPDSA